MGLYYVCHVIVESVLMDFKILMDFIERVGFKIASLYFYRASIDLDNGSI